MILVEKGLVFVFRKITSKILQSIGKFINICHSNHIHIIITKSANKCLSFIFEIGSMLSHFFVEYIFELLDSLRRHIIITSCDSPGTNKYIMEEIFFFFWDHTVHIQIILIIFFFSNFFSIGTFIGDSLFEIIINTFLRFLVEFYSLMAVSFEFLHKVIDRNGGLCIIDKSKAFVYCLFSLVRYILSNIFKHAFVSH